MTARRMYSERWAWAALALLAGCAVAVRVWAGDQERAECLAELELSPFTGECAAPFSDGWYGCIDCTKASRTATTPDGPHTSTAAVPPQHTASSSPTHTGSQRHGP